MTFPEEVVESILERRFQNQAYLLKGSKEHFEGKKQLRQTAPFCFVFEEVRL